MLSIHEFLIHYDRYKIQKIGHISYFKTYCQTCALINLFQKCEESIPEHVVGPGICFYTMTICNIQEIAIFPGSCHRFDSKNYCQTCALISLFQKCEKRVNGRMLLVHACAFKIWQFGTDKKLPTFHALSHFGRPFICKNSTSTSLLDFSNSHFPFRVFHR